MGMRVLVTGTDGYIGVLLASLLIEHGCDVAGMDTGFYRDGWLEAGTQLNRSPCMTKDIRHVGEEDLKGFDAVVHLAELSNDPLGQYSPAITHDINHRGTVNLASKCKHVGIRRFVYTSSCSVYGLGSDAPRTEESETDPQTAYAQCKVFVERDVSRMADDSFSPTFLRNATAYGYSPRMRFDLVLNNLAGLAWTTGKIAMISDGTPWRPLVHVSDICQAILCTLLAPRDVVHNQIFNVGDNKENYQIREIAELIARVFPGCDLTFGPTSGDNRSYRVAFDKINNRLPGFRCHRHALHGACELREVFEQVKMTRDIFEFRGFTRLKQLEHLRRTGQLDERFFWV
jgi:nucleoside-diphosphate-sugar epimerase